METPIGLMASAGITPMPTEAPGLNGIPKELKPRQNALTYPPPKNWCGLIGGLTNNILSCSTSLSCVLDNTAGAAGCCPATDGLCTGIHTTCYGYYDTCTGACAADTSILKCPGLLPYCGTYSFDGTNGGTYLYNCQATSMLFESSVEFLADYYLTAIGSTLISASNSFPSRTTGSAATANTGLNVQPTSSFTTSSDDDSTGLAAAAIGGIAAGVGLLVCFVAGLIIFFCLRSRKRKRIAASQSMAGHAPPTYQSPPVMQQPQQQQQQTEAQPIPQKDDQFQGSPNQQPPQFGYFGGPTDPVKDGVYSHVSPVASPSPSNMTPRPFSTVSSQHPGEQRPASVSPPIPENVGQGYYKPPNSSTTAEVDGTQGNRGVPQGQQPGRMEVDGTQGLCAVPRILLRLRNCKVRSTVVHLRSALSIWRLLICVIFKLTISPVLPLQGLHVLPQGLRDEDHMMSTSSAPRILFIDAYDSFSNNIISLLETDLEISVTSIKIDAPIHDFPSFLKSFSAVVAGPGPGHPMNKKDVGLFNELWKLRDEDLIPVLGICLGFQSLVYAFGGDIKPLPEPRHGISTTIRSCGTSIFQTSETCDSVQYHSLCAYLGHVPLSSSEDSRDGYDLWSPTKLCPDLVPLAWDFSYDSEKHADASSYAILMGVAHLTKPFHGIQFHPESICSSARARTVIASWWKEVMTWWCHNPLSGSSAGSTQTPKSNDTALKSPDGGPSQTRIEKPKRWVTTKMEEMQSLERGLSAPCEITSTLLTPPRTPPKVSSIVTQVDQWSVASICERLDLAETEVIVLDSEMHQRAEVGEYSIIGVVLPESLKLEYYTGIDHVLLRRRNDVSLIDLVPYGNSIYRYLQVFLDENRATEGHPNVPFWGGLIGYFTYEACLETIDIAPSARSRYGSRNPDLSFVMIERSIVVSHQTNTIHVQSIKPKDHEWVAGMARLLQSASRPQLPPRVPCFTSNIIYPDKAAYQAAIRYCQDSIRKGDAYELCLTSKAYITTNPPQSSPWALYLQLRKLNPAPFGAYVRLGGLSLLSSSPERFLRWSRPQKSQSNPQSEVIRCQFRPIKGTVKKQLGEQGLSDITLEEATEILATEKERAENLMIVDLIRHDLHGVVGSGMVHVPKLMVVEEYETVFQLVTVVEGELWLDDNKPEGQPAKARINREQCNRRLHNRHGSKRDMRPGTPASGSRNSSKVNGGSKSGIDILASSLPPGSMTGAPKRRACRILQGLEDNKPRGVYSGVVGYLDVGGGGDFSVVIRSAVRWDRRATEQHINHSLGPSARANQSDDTTAHRGDELCDEAGWRRGGEVEPEWTVGAGGAITSLSTEEGEWEEMMTKLRSTLRVFDGATVSGEGKGGLG
ncbi:MAG: hypothetical protein Q9191_005608 [Dirinaria sp. TL-2023a]